MTSNLYLYLIPQPVTACAGVEKQGGQVAADGAMLQACIQAARVRHSEVASLLRQALHAAGVPGYNGAEK